MSDHVDEDMNIERGVQGKSAMPFTEEQTSKGGSC